MVGTRRLELLTSTVNRPRFGREIVTLARAKAGSTQTQSLLVPPYHLDVELPRLVARDQRTSFTFRETFKSVGSGKDRHLQPPPAGGLRHFSCFSLEGLCAPQSAAHHDTFCR